MCPPAVGPSRSLAPKEATPQSMQTMCPVWPIKPRGAYFCIARRKTGAVAAKPKRPRPRSWPSLRGHLGLDGAARTVFDTGRETNSPLNKGEGCLRDGRLRPRWSGPCGQLGQVGWPWSRDLSDATGEPNRTLKFRASELPVPRRIASLTEGHQKGVEKGGVWWLQKNGRMLNSDS